MKQTTIKDIAKLAGVSYASVSRALNNKGHVSPKTREKILQICESQGYRTNILARNLIRKKTNVIGLVIPDASNPFYAEIALHIEIYMRKMGYNTMLCSTLNEEKTMEELFDFLLGQRVDGIILASSQDYAVKYAAKYAKDCPLVLLGSSFYEEDIKHLNIVSSDTISGGSIVAEYLLSLGHKKIAYIGHRPGSITHKNRLEGFARTLKRHGLDFTLIENSKSSSSIDSGYALGREFFQKKLSHTAIFAATDSTALGLLKAADEFHLKIPEDISLIGYDNIVYSSLPMIELTTIDQRKENLAGESAKLLLELLQNPKTECYTRRLIKPMLLERKSCRPCEA